LAQVKKKKFLNPHAIFMVLTLWFYDMTFIPTYQTLRNISSYQEAINFIFFPDLDHLTWATITKANILFYHTGQYLLIPLIFYILSL